MLNETSLASKKKKNEWHYVPIEGHWDEAVLPSGFPRRHWRQVSVSIGRMGFQQVGRYWQTGQQLIQNSGATYNVTGDPRGSERPWQMDPIPLVISAEEWALIERAVVQRATLLNLILADLYEKQQFLHDRLLPPALVFDNPHFLRPCHGFAPAGGARLHTYAVDLARSPDGHWWVIADRTQAPSGMGYAMENRLVSARTLPNAFNTCHVRQLTHFFDARRDTLLAMAATRRSMPRVVLLTPGPYNETYFEHSFLAGQWGFLLVEGADLTVRDGEVYLKTLAGLEPVDLIVRRLDDSFCDPIELRRDSLLGVPGLMQAARSGSVVVANALGSGLVETPAHMAFLPGLCRHVLGEELHIPSVATWWCGQEKPRQYVLDHLDQLVIKPAFPDFRRHAEFPTSIDGTASEDLIRRIEARPEEFVAQERVALSTAPVRTDSGLVPRHLVLRVFAAWDGKSSYTVMPGGLTRVSADDDSLIVSMQSGGGSKDTWVLGSAEHTVVSSFMQLMPVETPVYKGSLPSRVADNLFWLGRYTERVEARVRLVRALLPALSGEADFGRAASLETALRLLSGMRCLPPEDSPVSIGEQQWLVQRILSDMVYDPSSTSSLRWNLKQMRGVARNLKERLSSDTWRVLQELDSQFSTTPSHGENRYLAEMTLLDSAIVTLSAFAGLLSENTTRGPGWRFLEVGRRMERAVQMGELLRSGIAEAPPEVEPYLQLLLQIADSSITYRTRYLSVLRTDLVLELLLVDESNPRSVGFQLATLLHQLERLQEHDEARRRGVERPLASKILASIRGANVTELSERDSEGRLEKLEKLIVELVSNLHALSDALTANYLVHLAPSPLRVSL